jgi:hypothetical protein
VLARRSECITTIKMRSAWLCKANLSNRNRAPSSPTRSSLMNDARYIKMDLHQATISVAVECMFLFSVELCLKVPSHIRHTDHSLGIFKD